MRDLFLDFVGEVSHKGGEWNACDLVAVSSSQTHGFVFHFIIAENEEVSRLKLSMVADFLHDVVARIIHFHTDTLCTEGLSDLSSVGFVFLSNRDDMALGRCEPGREPAGKMLDENATKPFHGTEWGTMNHHGSVQFTIASLVGQIKSLGEVVIHLDGTQLPFSTDDVLYDEVNLRAVKGGFALLL